MNRKEISAEAFVHELTALRLEDERVRMGQIFGLAKEFIDLEPEEIEKLLDGPTHEARVGAVSIMGKQATRKTTPESRRRSSTALPEAHGQNQHLEHLDRELRSHYRSLRPTGKDATSTGTALLAIAPAVGSSLT